MKKSFVVISLMFGVFFGLTFCTKNNGVLNLNPATETASGDTLFSVKTASGPSIAGAGAVWGGPDHRFGA